MSFLDLVAFGFLRLGDFFLVVVFFIQTLLLIPTSVTAMNHHEENHQTSQEVDDKVLSHLFLLKQGLQSCIICQIISKDVFKGLFPFPEPYVGQ